MAARWLRPLVGPTVIGVSTWCALGDVSLAIPDQTAVRLAVPADWFWLPLAAAFAALVPAWRRHPSLAAPALVATLPFWPVPLPAAALLWAGRMAWLPVLLAVIAAGVWTVRSRNVRPDSAGPAPPATSHRLNAGASAVAAGASTLALVVFAAWSLAVRLPGGDEVHYLVITQSLLADGDLQIENNHAQRDYAPYYPVEIRPDYLRRGTDGAIYSIHSPGTSVAVLPGFAMFGYLGAQATFVLFAAIAGALLWLAARRAAGDRTAAWVAWLAIVSTPTFLIQGVTIFPDGAGALLVAAAVALIVRLAGPAGGGTASFGVERPAFRPASADLKVRSSTVEVRSSTVEVRSSTVKARRSTGSTRTLVALSIVLAALPWLHTRFAVLSVGLGAIAFALVWAPSEPASGRGKRAALFAIVPVVSAVAWFGYFQLIYGTPDPRAPYGDAPNTSLAYVPGGWLALFFDNQFGLLTYSPILAAAFVGLVAGGASRARRLAWALMAVAGAYLAATALYWMWWAGVPASPARFAAAALPLFAVPLALAWRAASPAGRALLATLAAISSATSAALMWTYGGRLAWNTRGIRSAWLDWLNGIVDLSRGLPSFFWRLQPDDLTSERSFVLHVFVWAAILAAVVAAALRLRARGPVNHRAFDGAAAAWTITIALTTAVQAGWWLNGTSLNPAASQLTVLGRVQAGARVFTTSSGGWGWRRADVSKPAVTEIRATRDDDVGGEAGWLPFLDVPAGRYAVAVNSHRPRPGRLAFRIGRSAMPLRVLDVGPVSVHTTMLDLPSGASALFLEAAGEFAGVGGTVTFTPIALAPRSPGYATASARYGDVDVFFLGPDVYAEPDGFWTRGAKDVELRLGAESRRRSVTLEVENGGVPNEVTIASLAGTARRHMSAGERFETVLPLADGAAALTIGTTSGFRWSEVRGGDDQRWLGVRVRVVE